MQRDDIISMARDVGLSPTASRSNKLAMFAAIVAATEREVCATLAEQTICDTHLPTGINIYGSRVAAAIRARSNA